MVTSTRNWEETFVRWSKPSSDDEEDKIARTERMIRASIQRHEWFGNRQPTIYTKGSYANNTNVRLDSDVDEVVESTAAFFYNSLSVPGFNVSAAGIYTPAPYDYWTYKNEVEKALVDVFGRYGVTRGNKAFDVHENTVRVDANVVAAWEYRLYCGLGPNDFYKGSKFVADDGTEIINWPHHQKANGNAKNVRTGLRYKYITRVVKRLRNVLADAGYTSTDPMVSYFVECLMYNCPDYCYDTSRSYSDNVRSAIAHIAADQQPDTAWHEVNEMKYLFGAGQTWTRQQARNFALDAWGYCGFVA
jgi:hypothetical protein